MRLKDPNEMKLKDYFAVSGEAVTDFAARVRVTATTVWRWLSGTRHPNRAQMQAIHKATRGAVTPNDLVLDEVAK
jgi:DNA-binding transcriptional regulator YdaS (Cro superfamily)